MASSKRTKGYLGGGRSSSPSGDVAKKLSRIERAKTHRRTQGYDELWAKLVKLYSSKYDYPELGSYKDVIAPNLAFSTQNVIVPSVVINYPKITVTALTPEGAPRAQVVEDVVNHLWRRYDIHEEYRLATEDFVTLGFGIIKTVWETQVVKRDITPEEWQSKLTDMLAEKEMAIEAGIAEDELPSDDDISLGVPKKVDEVLVDRPNVSRVSPFDWFVDPDATKLKDARWVAERMFVPLETARKNPEWREGVRRNLQGTSLSESNRDHDLNGTPNSSRGDADFVVVWEYYDLLNNTVCVMAEGCDGYLRGPEKIPYEFGHPYVMIRNYNVNDVFYPIGDLETIAPLQIELATTRTQMVNDRKRYRRMYMVRQESIGEDGMEALQSGEDNVFVPVDDANRDFRDMLAPVETSSLPPEFYNQSSMIAQDIDVVSGVTEYQRGSLSEIRRTATEASLLQDGANARSADKLAKVESGIGKVAERLIVLSRQFLTVEDVAVVLTDEGEQQWLKYTSEDLEGDFQFVVEGGSTQPQNESFRRQSALQLMDAVAPLVGQGIIDPMKLAVHVLRNGFGIKDAESWLAPPPPPPEAMPPAGGGMPPEGMPPGGGMPPMPPEGMPPEGLPPGMMGGM